MVDQSMDRENGLLCKYESRANFIPMAKLHSQENHLNYIEISTTIEN